MENNFNSHLFKLKNAVDMTGLGLDEGIMETVANFNYSGIKTSGSCYGHVDEKEDGIQNIRLPFIWVDADCWEELQIAESVYERDICIKYKISRDDLFDTLDLYWDDKLKLKMTELQLKIAEEYVGLRDGLYSSELGLKYKNGLLRVQEKINVLLAEFYRSRTADKKYKLINRHNKGRVCSTLEQRIDIVSEKDLELCRKEIEDFGLFLKNR